MKNEASSFIKEECHDGQQTWLDVGVYFFEMRFQIVLFSFILCVLGLALLLPFITYRDVKTLVKLGQVDSKNPLVSSQVLEQTILNKFADDVEKEVGYKAKLEVDYMDSSGQLLRIKTPVPFFNNAEVEKIIKFQDRLLFTIIKDQNDRINLIEKNEMELLKGEKKRNNSGTHNLARAETILAPKVSEVNIVTVKNCLIVTAFVFVSIILSVFLALTLNFYSQVKDSYLKNKR